MAAILGGLALAWSLQRYAAGSPERLLGALTLLASLLAVLGVAVVIVSARGGDYGLTSSVGLIRNKNGAATLVMIGALLHALLAEAARRGNRPAWALLHGVVAAFLADVWALPAARRARPALTAAVLLLGLFTARASWIVNTRNRSNVAEPLLQIHYTDDVPAALDDVGWILSTSMREADPHGVLEGVLTGAVPVVRDWPLIAPWGGAEGLMPPEWVVATVEEAVERVPWSGAKQAKRPLWVYSWVHPGTP